MNKKNIYLREQNWKYKVKYNKTVHFKAHFFVVAKTFPKPKLAMRSFTSPVSSPTGSGFPGGDKDTDNRRTLKLIDWIGLGADSVKRGEQKCLSNNPIWGEYEKKWLRKTSPCIEKTGIMINQTIDHHCIRFIPVAPLSSLVKVFLKVISKSADSSNNRSKEEAT